MASCLFAYNLF